MSAEAQIFVSYDEFDRFKLIELGIIRLSREPTHDDPPRIKCPKCGFGVRFALERIDAEACLCSIAWVATRGAGGGVTLYGAKEVIEAVAEMVRNLS